MLSGLDVWRALVVHSMEMKNIPFGVPQNCVSTLIHTPVI